MQNKTLINDRIKREYEKMRDERANFLRKQQENLYLNFPEIRFIDEKISTLAITHASRILTEGITPDEAVAAVQCEKEALLARRNDILTSADYHEQEVPFNCSLCQDTGVVNGQKCECYIKLFSKIMLEGIDGSKDLSFDFENCLFDNFSLEWYSKEIDSHIGISPYDNMKTVYRDALMFCEIFDDESKNLYFYGKAGTGKTFTAGCIANKLISKGYSVLYQSAYKLCQFMEDFKFGRIDRNANIQSFENIYNCDLLIIDDLGTEFSTAYTCSVLFDILNTRILNKKSTVISSNLSLDNLTKKYTDRVASRIIGYFDIMRFTGDDIRIAKKQNRR